MLHGFLTISTQIILKYLKILIACERYIELFWVTVLEVVKYLKFFERYHLMKILLTDYCITWHLQIFSNNFFHCMWSIIEELNKWWVIQSLHILLTLYWEAASSAKKSQQRLLIYNRIYY